MLRIIEDLTNLSPSRLERRLERIARDALPCLGVFVFDGTPTDGLTVGLSIESEGRRDVLDLARVLESEPGGQVTVAWSCLSPGRSKRVWRLLLRVQFKRPVLCSFVIRFDVRDHPRDKLRSSLPLLLAADRFALCFDGDIETERPTATIPSPLARDCVVDAIAAVGV